MTNWNDGQIHGWNGGDCPVHPETMVKYWMRKGGSECVARCINWNHNKTKGDIIAFRVVKEYVDPKVIWVNEYAHCCVAYASEEAARLGNGLTPTRIAVKYVEAIADAKEAQK